MVIYSFSILKFNLNNIYPEKDQCELFTFSKDNNYDYLILGFFLNYKLAGNKNINIFTNLRFVRC